jgi:hypothetical protein
MKKNLILTAVGYFFFGVGLTIQRLGIKADLGLWPTIVVFTVCTIFYMYTVIVPLEKLKQFIKKHENGQCTK